MINRTLTAEQYQALNGRSRSKQGNRRSACRQGHNHDSGKEARRCDELHLMQKSGVISNLLVQKPVFGLRVNDELITTYRPDFSYTERGERVIEDVKPDAPADGTKPHRTDRYCMVAKLMHACLGITIRET